MSSLYCAGPNGFFGFWYGSKDGTREALSGSNIAGSSSNPVHCLNNIVNGSQLSSLNPPPVQPSSCIYVKQLIKNAINCVDWHEL